MQLQALRANRARQQVARQGVIQAPTGGWDASSPLAAMPKDRAVELTNWFPQPGYIEVRRGCNYHAWDLVSDTTPVVSLMPWAGMASAGKLFAGAGTIIYDVTTEGIGTSSDTGWTNTQFQWTNFVNSGGTYLYIVNGANDPKHYNGSAWATPSLTGATPANMININVHKKRIWFIEKNTTKAWYLATDAIAGALTSFELGSNFKMGGYLMAMGTWTRDGGSGSDDYAVFISSRGEAAVYQGTDPAAANTWALVGVFQVPAPIGRRCFANYGADLALLTIEGVYPLSQLFSVDQSQVRGVALSQNIQTEFNAKARDNSALFGWEICVYPRGTRMIVNVPNTEFDDSDQYVMNTLTGAWAKFQGQHANCWCVFRDKLYFGGNDGAVYEGDTGSADVATPISATAQCAYQAFSSPGTLKRFTAMQGLITSSQGSQPSLGISVDFEETSDMSISSSVGSSGIALWDQAEWDDADWAGSIQQTNNWFSVPALGRFASVKITAQTGVEQTGSDGSYWGIDTWGSGLWGGTDFGSDEIMRVNGFIVLYESGSFI
jgi:hypothetical protein